ncbi:MAG: 2-C-methyl-D-erythritol 4-phosphate cytidylyltransferase [Paludibacteraceae bacterium]|nr:2-C-methyl-D-erythritol 4-phosphate cytidylyltransferase [Paludibacteraceae bacterium]
MYNIAIILAGGIGSRVGGRTPKQLLPLEDGRSVLEHTIDAFETAPSIDEIAVVMHPDHINTLQKLCQNNPWQKLKKVIPGGAERWESSYNAIKEYTDLSNVSLWLHDAARPFVSQTIIANIADALQTHDAVTVAVPVTDTVYIVDKNDKCQMANVKSIPDRATVMRAQTPQAFHLNTIQKAYEKAIALGNIIATDDAGIVHKYLPGTSIYIVPGDESNRKITFKEDL